MFERGERVSTPQGLGTVMWKRMAPPDFATVAAYSISLDSKAGNPSYYGTIFAADEVQPIPKT